MPELRYVGNAGRYRLTNSDVDVAQGETVTVDEEMAAYLQEHGKFEVVEDSGGAESGTLPFNTDAQTVGEIEDRVADIDDVEVLRALKNLEQDQQDRTTAVEAIEGRLDELED